MQSVATGGAKKVENLQGAGAKSLSWPLAAGEKYTKTPLHIFPLP
jgi:hypothetical protein